MTPAPAPGARIGPYEIVSWLGSGGMGEVYRARDPRLGRNVAIKLITGVSAADPSRIRRFEQEARAAGQLNHPSVLAIYDTGLHDGAPYIVSELLEGESMRSRLQKSALPTRKAIDYARQAAEGLAAAHDKGIVHRDVKPDNLFITTEGRIKILDFGIAKLTAPADSVVVTGAPTDTAAGSVVGTARYMSPEQVRGETVDARSDIFSLGVVLYEMISGRPAFARNTAVETMTAILNEDPPEPAAVSDAPALARIVSRCLEKTREARFQSARDLAFGLDVLSSSQPMATVSGRPPRWRIALGGGILVLGVAGAAAFWWSRAEPPSIERQLAAATFTPFVDFDGSESDAAISRDGKFVAFLGERNDHFHVWLKQVGTGTPVDVTRGLPDIFISPNRNVGFSPDGSEIWISGLDRQKGGVALIPLMGGKPRPFLADRAINVAWSTDGTRLVYFTRDDDPLIVTDAKGNNAVQILPPVKSNHNHFPAFSIDDRWIYYAHGEQSVTEYDIWRIPAEGGTPERLTDLRTNIRYLTPFDSHTLLFVAPAPDHSGPWLWALDVDRRTTRRVSTGLDRYLSIAADGNRHRLVATVAKSTAGLWTVPIRQEPANEGDVKPSLVTARAVAPRFSGGSVFYLSDGAAAGLWRWEAGEAVEVLKASDTPLSEPPAVSPDGEHLAVLLPARGQLRLTIVSRDGRDPRPIGETINARGTAAWAPDGLSVAVGGSDRDGAGLFRVPIDGGAPVRLANGAARDPAWSADGSVIVYEGEQSARAPLLAVNPETRHAVTLPAISVLTGGHGRSRFLGKSRQLIYMPEAEGPQNFWLLDLDTGLNRQLTRLGSRAFTTTFDITPDGTQIVFDRGRELSDVVLIDLPQQR